MCGVLQEKKRFRPDNHGMLSKRRFDGAVGTVERVLELHTMLCRVREKRERSQFCEGHDVEGVTEPMRVGRRQL